jgi:hypothetical protein
VGDISSAVHQTHPFLAECQARAWAVDYVRNLDRLTAALGAESAAAKDPNRLIKSDAEKQKDHKQKRNKKYQQIIERTMANVPDKNLAATTNFLGKLNKEDGCVVLRNVYGLKGTSKQKAEDIKNLLKSTFNENPNYLWEQFAAFIETTGEDADEADA